ncbi:MAG: hypothetical protein JWO59_1609 [Chloroflexi bacterium]|nr:hypothetical protein [Chloroflexota bacterium]
MSRSVAFYTVGNSRYFPGLVGLVNSLRHCGHTEEIFVLDAGLTNRQREMLKGHCTLVERPSEHVSNPTMYKSYPSLLRTPDVVVIIDCDMIVTRSLVPLLERARSGQICGFADPESDRWFAEWQQLFELPQSPRRQLYVNAGFFAFSTQRWPLLLRWYAEACGRVRQMPTLYEGAKDGPSAQGDQDALNAIFMARVPAEALHVLPKEEAPDGYALWRDWVTVVDARTLACRCRGQDTWLIHSSGVPKAWERAGWFRVRNSAYVRLLRRLLWDTQSIAAIPETELPIWLRPGPAGLLAIHGLDLANAPAIVRLRDRPVRVLRKWRHIPAANM